MINSWLLVFYVLTTSKAISGWVLTCDSVPSGCLYSAAQLGKHAADIPLSHYPDTELTNQSMPYSNNAERLARK